MINVDSYYSYLNLSKTPPSVDCLMIHICERKGKKLDLFELKSTSLTERLNIPHIQAKFKNTVDDFILDRFFDPIGKYDYDTLKLFLVTNIKRRDKGISLRLFSQRVNRIKFKDDFYYIKLVENGYEVSDC
jgi:hypothetical protein